LTLCEFGVLGLQGLLHMFFECIINNGLNVTNEKPIIIRHFFTFAINKLSEVIVQNDD
jgi:hypothetical protein